MSEFLPVCRKHFDHEVGALLVDLESGLHAWCKRQRIRMRFVRGNCLVNRFAGFESRDLLC
jgi:hypothetical protein